MRAPSASQTPYSAIRRASDGIGIMRAGCSRRAPRWRRERRKLIVHQSRRRVLKLVPIMARSMGQP